jgi:hypothetical protein
LQAQQKANAIANVASFTLLIKFFPVQDDEQIVRFILVTNDPFETEENAKIVGPTTPI